MTNIDVKNTSDKVNHLKYTGEITDIIREINKACNKGDYSIKVNLSYYSRMYFESSGFRIINISGLFSRKNWVIKWD